MAETFFLLVAMHSLCDFPLQGEAMGKGKNRRKNVPGAFGPDFPPWWAWLSAHAFVHGGGVAVVTGVWWLGLVEAGLHAAIDHLKCSERISFAADQALHVVCKAGYVVFLAL